MTILEYLKIINDVPANEPLTAQNLYKFGGGFTDIVPDKNEFDNVAELSIPTFFVGEEGLIVRRTIGILENGKLVRKKVERETNLNDDLELHCGKRETPVRVLADTIAGLSEIHESELRLGFTQKKDNFPTKISALKEALEHYKSLETPEDEKGKTPGL